MNFGSMFSSSNIFSALSSISQLSVGSLFSNVQGKKATSGFGGVPIASVSNFINRFGHGLARPNKYLVEFRLPKGFSETASHPGVNSESAASKIRGVESSLNKDNTIGLMCHNATLPQRAIETHTHKQLVGPYKVPKGQQEYDLATFSLYADGNLNTRHYFDVWQTAVVNIGSNTLNFYNEYTSDINIYILGEDGVYSPYFITLYEAWPVNIGQVELSYGNNMFLDVTASFSYKYWQSSFDDTRRGSM